ncbi:MAG: aminotransferase class III-fold pyridoxal phosphate-dependent enzyme [Terrimicrobiaceae bacterium]
MLPEILAEIPGPQSRALMEKLARFESRNVTFFNADFPVFWERASGGNVWDADGNRYLDMTSGFGVCGLGHGATSDALVAQAGKLVHGLGDVHPSPLKAALCQAISRITFERWGEGPAKTFLCNSGSDAVEAALKTALLHSGKPGVISFTGGYHGLGLGALESCGLPFFRDPFAGQLAKFGVRLPYPYCCRCPFGRTEGFRLEGREFPNCSSSCLESLRGQLDKAIRQREIGCILVEPVQARGGDIVPPKDFLPLLRQVCDEQKILLIADEIYTGFHRTGRFFACEHSDVVPDIICLGKGLTGGFPLSACTGKSHVMDAWPRSAGEALHTSTFLGHPVGCAMALASIAEHEKPGAAAQAKNAGRLLHAALSELEAGHLRGLGAMIGLELVTSNGAPDTETASQVVVNALKAGLILLGGGPEGNVLSFAPTFALAAEEAEWIGALMKKLLPKAHKSSMRPHQ